MGKNEEQELFLTPENVAKDGAAENAAPPAAAGGESAPKNAQPRGNFSDRNNLFQREIKQRKHARRTAVQALFEIDSVGHAPGIVVDEHLALGELNEQGGQYFRWLVTGVVLNLAELNAQIQRYAPEWPVAQLAIIDRNILRLALFELCATETNAPTKVVINEAIELAKLFGSESSPRFVNGVLGAAMNDADRVTF